jgi:WD40 repeat protein
MDGDQHSYSSDSPYPLVKRDDYIRLILQALNDLGFEQSAQLLSKEAKIQLHSESVTKFCQSILLGDWDSVEALIDELQIESEDDIVSARFLIYEQKYLELLEQRKIKEALDCLRKNLTPLNKDQKRVHKLSSFMIFRDVEEFKRRADWDGATGRSRHRLLERLRRFISSQTLLPERRLERLVLQAIQLQKRDCLYHNAPDDALSLFEDHRCSPLHLPRKVKHVLSAHTDEVWFVQFSHNGKYLASASKDKTAIIWNVTEEPVRLMHVLAGHMKEVSYLAWSADDEYLATAGSDNCVRMWRVSTGEGLQCVRHTDAVTACTWTPDSKHVISGSLDEKICMWDLGGNLVRTWNFASSQINDLALTPDGKKLIVSSQDPKIRIYDLESATKVAKLDEKSAITSLTVSADGNFLLVNVAAQEIHVWDLRTNKLLSKYRGHKSGRFVIRSAFGGVDQGFIVSGSEDFNVYIWNRQQSTLLECLNGHTGIVNSVSWNSKNPYQIASGSDDYTVRVWEAEAPAVGSHQAAQGKKRKKRASRPNARDDDCDETGTSNGQASKDSEEGNGHVEKARAEVSGGVGPAQGQRDGQARGEVDEEEKGKERVTSLPI